LALEWARSRRGIVPEAGATNREEFDYIRDHWDDPRSAELPTEYETFARYAREAAKKLYPDQRRTANRHPPRGSIIKASDH
jgi:hypothetical protein